MPRQPLALSSAFDNQLIFANQRISPTVRPDKGVIYAIFLLYLVLSGYALLHHELWSDELHSWNIAKGSGAFTELIAHTRYEGHPPGWYILLWLLSKISHRLILLQLAQWLIAVSVAFIVLFRSPFPLIIKLLIPFGYYFLFEYGILSRNYAGGVLLAFLLCRLLRKDLSPNSPLYQRPAPLPYYILLFCLASFHLLTLLLAASIHLYFLFCKQQRRLLSFQTLTRSILPHALLGFLLLSIPAWFIIPPSDSQMNAHFWMSRWSAGRLLAFEIIPIQSFIPIPAWWDPHPWNTQFLLELKNPLLNFITALLLLLTPAYILYNDKKCLALFYTNLLLSYIASTLAMPLTIARHTGFVYIGFLAALWLHREPLSKTARQLTLVLLSLQLIGAIFFITADIQKPFSNCDQVEELQKEIPPGGALVTDYWTMNAISAFTDRPVYCLDAQKELSFLLFDSCLLRMQQRHSRFTDGMRTLARDKHIRTVYMISQNAPATVRKIDPQLETVCRVTLLDKKEGAIKPDCNLYLYKIELEPTGTGFSPF